MAETLTEADTFDATIQWPSANELASAADVRDKAIQRLTNRTRNHKNRIDAAEAAALAVAATKVTAGVARYSIDADTYTVGQNLALTVDQADTGYSLDGTSKLVTVPAQGWYIVTVSAQVETDAITDNAEVSIRVDVSGSAKLRAFNVRPSTTTSMNIGLYTSGPVWVATPADAIKLNAQLGIGNLITLASVQNTLGIMRIGAP